MNRTGFDFNGHLVFSIHCVEMRYAMLVEEHADDDAQKSADLRQGGTLIAPLPYRDDDAIVLDGRQRWRRRSLKCGDDARLTPDRSLAG